MRLGNAHFLSGVHFCNGLTTSSIIIMHTPTGGHQSLNFVLRSLQHFDLSRDVATVFFLFLFHPDGKQYLFSLD